MTQDNSSAQLVDAPEHIWLLDYGSGECVWCNCPAPDAEDHEPVKYVRADLIERLTRPQPSTSSVEAVARAIMEAQPYNLSPDEAMNCARAVLALPSPEREPMREALAFACAALREVGDDYPGSSCQKWCHEKAAAAERMGSR